jgi:SAM-dependent methyltransferase
MTDWTELNRALWDERAGPHAASPDYALERFVAEPGYLSSTVQFDLPLIGDVSGLRGVHLQCHIGTDTLSLHRLGARMTGLDFSSASIAQARSLASRVGAPIDYVEAEFDHALDVLPPGEFDLVYTGIGALCWLPHIDRWAEVVAGLLAPGGRLFIREGHPVLWALDERRTDGLLALKYPYFERDAPTTEDEPGTYVQTEHEFANASADWNHGLGEIVTALLRHGLTLTGLVEHDSVPWDPMQDDTFEPIGGGHYRLRDRPWRLPHTYTLQAVKPAHRRQARASQASV